MFFTGAEALIIQGGLNIGGTILGMGSAYGADKINAINADAEAKITLEDSKQQAAVVRRQGAAVKGAARTALAASGVDLAGGGTVDVIEQQITKDTETDAYATLLTGERTAAQLRQKGSDLRRGAKDAITAGALGVGDTILGSGDRLGKWIKANPGKTLIGLDRPPGGF